MITCKESESQFFFLWQNGVVKNKSKKKLIENATMWNFAGISDEDILGGGVDGGVEGRGRHMYSTTGNHLKGML